MKKLLALSAALSLVSVQAFAQTAETPAPAAAPVAETAPASTNPMARLQNATGLTPGALVAVGVAVAATIAIVADNGDDSTTTTHHATTTHH
jgi:hypothetical protein